jgi:hypothetical protein
MRKRSIGWCSRHPKFIRFYFLFCQLIYAYGGKDSKIFVIFLLCMENMKILSFIIPSMKRANGWPVQAVLRFASKHSDRPRSLCP